MVNDAGGGGGGAVDPGAGADVSVEINGMLDFYLEMQRIPADANEVHTALAEVSPLIESGLNAWGSHGEVFPEGAQWAAIMRDRQHQFSRFMQDVSNGILSIASASAVIAEMYGDGDFHSAVDLNDVAFAFGDRGSTPPNGFRDAQTWSEHRAQQQGGAYPLALMGDRSTAHHYSPTAGVDIYQFSDGSSIQVVTTTNADGQRVSETTIFGPPVAAGGPYPSRPVIETTTVQTERRPDGTEVETTSVVTGTEYDGSTSTTVRETATDGAITVTNTTSTVVGGGGPFVTTSDPVVVPAGENPVPQPDPGPLEEAQEALDSHGSAYYVEEFGYRP